MCVCVCVCVCVERGGRRGGSGGRDEQRAPVETADTRTISEGQTENNTVQRNEAENVQM